MAPIVADWRIDLMRAHQRLFEIMSDEPERSFGDPNCDEGWHDLLERACTRIDAALAKGGAFRTQQIKEKFGALRFYWNGDLSATTRVKVGEAIALATARSACTCEICGLEGRLYTSGGWLATACDEHAKGKPVPVKPGYENLHIVRIFGPERRFPIISCRRYVRETDSFVDVNPKSLKVEE